jgi:hypothetical protein
MRLTLQLSGNDEITGFALAYTGTRQIAMACMELSFIAKTKRLDIWIMLHLPYYAWCFVVAVRVNGFPCKDENNVKVDDFFLAANLDKPMGTTKSKGCVQSPTSP